MADQRNDDQSFPEPPDGLLTAPNDHVLAFLDTPEAVAAAMNALVESGFSRDGVYVLAGPEGAAKLEASEHRHGLRSRIHRVMEWMGDEREVLVRSGDHLSGGGLVMTVPADDATKATAAHILAAHGAREIAHFGKRHWEPLGG